MDSLSLDYFKTLLKMFAAFTDDELDTYASQLTKKIYKTDEYFSTPDAPSTMLAFIAKGFFRRYVIDRDGNDITVGFISACALNSSYGGIVLNEMLPLYIQAMEESVTYVLPRDEFMKWWERDSNWKDALQKITEYDYLSSKVPQLDTLQYDAQTRYVNFVKRFPEVESHLKQKHIATFLNMSPETLSRIRKNLSKN